MHCGFVLWQLRYPQAVFPVSCLPQYFLLWVQVPSTWRAVIENSATLQLFLDFYRSTTPPLSSMALECLVRLSGQKHAGHTACRMANAVMPVPECLVCPCDCPPDMWS